MSVAALAPSALDGLLSDPFRAGLAFAGFCLLVLVGVSWRRLLSWYRGRHRPVLTPVQVEELLLGVGALIVDLRDPETFKQGHIRGALHVPFPDVPARFPKPDPTARRAMVLVDDTDALAHRAYELLAARGFQWIYVMKGGFKAWRREHRPITR